MNVYTALRMANDLSSRMLDALHVYANNPQGSTARRNNGRGGGTHGALVRRGLVALGVDARGESGYFLTPKAWAFLRAQYGTVRPADAGRLTLDQALAEAYPAEPEQVEQTAPAAPRSGGVVIPGALADYLTAESPLDLDTRDALDAARRGAGRTLVIHPKTVAVLHVISRNAEYLLGSAYTTEAQQRAARVWLDRAGRAPQVVTTRYASTREAYDAAMSSDTVRNGDVLVVEAEAAVAFLWKSHPVAVTAAHGEFHRAEGDPREVEANTGPSVRTAVDAAYAIGAPLARVEDQADAEQALAEAAAADAPEANPTVEDLAVTVACPTCHVAAGVRCVTRAGKAAREPHGRRFEALEQAAGITEHRATAHREAEARGGWVVALDRKAEAALMTAYAARINARAEARLDAVETEADEQFTRTAHAADAVEHAEQVEAAVETVAEAVALYDAHLAAEPVRCTLHGDACDRALDTPHHFAGLNLAPAAPRTAPTICPEFVALDPDDLITDEWRTAAALVTEAEATEGTWRGAWIGEHQADDALFVVDQAAEQGALFDSRATD
ncbi:hypothetical protein AB0O67_06580 [Streptomyces sp. NPDC086077]|uniref:zinc finger domain-containing protein n=1 Tax=Streptomyces sp. NPDC086077 TaxID=3154862 RepID=UPI003433EABD